jgi:hypothetical protein
MSDRTPQIGGQVLTQCYTSLTPVGTGPGTSAPPLGTLLADDSAPNKVYEFGKWLSATTGLVGGFAASSYANTLSVFPQYDLDGATGTGLDAMAGIHMGAPTQNQYCWIQKLGLSSAALVNSTTDIAKGDSLKGVSGQQYAVKDAAIGTTPSYMNYLRALAARTADTTGVLDVFINCLRG